MQDKLMKLLTIKIDAIRKNIDNLNYLNEELEKNNHNLIYIENILNLFGSDDNYDVLNLDKIEKNEFDKVISMIDSKVKDVFEDKICNYHGIMYIIQGIRQGISLSLTIEQENAINLFIAEIKVKILELFDTINRLKESKSRLPETDLDLLNQDLEHYNDIVLKFENNEYLTAIEEILSALDFSEITLEEKNDIFAYILKYNRDIYEKQKEEKNVIDKTEQFISLPEVNITGLEDENNEVVNLNDDVKYQIPIDEQEDLSNTIDIEEIIRNIDEKLKELEEKNKTEENSISLEENIVDNPIQGINLDEFKLGEDFNNQSPDLNISDSDYKVPEFEEFNNILDSNLNSNSEPEDKDVSRDVLTFSQEPINLAQEVIEIKPVEIQNEMSDIKTENVDVFDLDLTNKEELNVSTPAISENEQGVEEFMVHTKQNENFDEGQLIDILTKHDLLSLKDDILTKRPIDLNELANNLNILAENQILDVFKENKETLVLTILNNNSNDLNFLFNLIKNEYSLNEKNYQQIIPFFVVTLPSVFTNQDIMKTFIDNTEYFKHLNINLINLFDNYRELLIIDTNILKENYDKIVKYGLTLTNDNVKYLLANKKVLENLDYYIEAIGHEKVFLGRENEFDGIEYITKHPYKLTNINRNVLIKLRYATENGMKIYGNKPGILAGEITNPKVDILSISDEYMSLYFDNEYGFIDRSELSLLLESIKDTQQIDLNCDDNIIKLDSLYKKNDLKYKIEGLYFSRIKTIRIYNFLKDKNIDLKHALIIALTYNSVIKRDEYLKIEKIINDLLGGN